MAGAGAGLCSPGAAPTVAFGPALGAGFGTLATRPGLAGNGVGFANSAPRPGRGCPGAEAGATLVFGEDPGADGAAGFGFADGGGGGAPTPAARGDDFVSGGAGRGKPGLATAGVLAPGAGAAGNESFESPPSSDGARGAFGTESSGSAPLPGEALSGAGGTSLSGMTKPHFLHFIRTDRPATFSSAIWYFALQLGQRNFIR
jgi:hypothetical protein